MNILYHHRTRAEDAQGIHIRALCEAFRDLGHTVRVVGPVDPSRRQPTSAVTSPRGDGAHLFGFRMPHWLYELLAIGYNVPDTLALLYHVLRYRPQLVYERYALFSISGRVVSALFGIPFVLEVNAPLSLELQEHGGLVFRRLAQRVEDWSCRHATRTVVVSSAMAEIFIERGVPRDRLMVVPNGVDRRHFHPQVDGKPVRHRLRLDDRLTVGFVGWVRPWHGVGKLIEAVALLPDLAEEVAVVIVGDGPALPELKEQARTLGVADRVTFTGGVPQSEVPAFLAAMDVAVQPDVTAYASPIKLFEYLAMGKTIIAPRRPNIEEVVADGRQALLFTPGEARELAATIRRLHRSPELRRELAAAALELFEERKYYWEANARRVLRAVGR
ncbi:MAG TPA: glycosyltransferase family 4 protein [Methylomirabilota bacterium]|nr:glycosyltransferase family 4 protein [Methylomirabilota bacterium]